MKSVMRLMSFAKPYWRWMVLAPFLMMLEVMMDLMQPRMIQTIIDEGIMQLDIGLVVRTGLLMIALAFVGALGGIGNGVFASRAAQGFGADLRDALFRKVQGFSFRNLDQFETGQLVTRLTNDVTHMHETLFASLRILIRSPLLMVGSLAMAIVTAPKLTFVPLTLIPVVLVGVVLIVSRATPLFTSIQRRLDDLNEVLQENLAGVRVVKAFVRAEDENRRFGVINESLVEQTVRAVQIVAITRPFMMTTMNLGLVAVLWLGGLRVTEGTMQVGQIVAFINYLLRTLMSLLMVSMLVMRLARAKASAERIEEVLDAEPDVVNRQGAVKDVSLRGQIAFEGATFSYQQDGGDPVLRDVHFEARPGQTVALLGATGAGKSSLVHLIPRFYDVTGGRVSIDGLDVRDVDLATLRRHVGIALQETVLFSGTIRDNIRYGRPDASEEEVIAAAKAAQAHDFIMSFPDGYDSVVGQRGVNLSGGQKQRIAIARALLIRPAVLILDDSTSSVDVETEAKIEEALQERRGEGTSIIIAQRISTVLNADQIIVLDDGAVVASGTHRELLETSPHYREIYDSQLGNGVVVHG